ncbi:MAG: hypothetical protein AAF587_21280 [Bacteroidota bacterium]
MQEMVPVSTPIIIEIDKSYPQVSVLSLFNMSLVEFLAFFSNETFIQEIRVQSQSIRGNIEEEVYSKVNIFEAQRIVRKTSRKGISIDLELANSKRIDSNFNDEIFYTFPAHDHPQDLIQRILTSRDLEGKYLIPLEDGSFCYEVTEGQLTRYDSIMRYLEQE